MALYNEQSGTTPNWALYSPSYINHPEYIPPPYNCAGITFDQQTWDEMFIGYFSYAVLPCGSRPVFYLLAFDAKRLMKNVSRILLIGLFALTFLASGCTTDRRTH